MSASHPFLIRVPHPHALLLTFVCLLGSECRTQCQPATTYLGFHQENVGAVLSAQVTGGRDEALFGHFTGYSTGYFERRRNDWWWREQLMGGSGSGPSRMGIAVALRGDIAALGDTGDYSLPGFSSFNPNGAAVVYERAAGAWSRISDLYPPAAAAQTQFGAQVGIADDGSRVLVGAPLANGSGEVHVYIRQPSGWLLEQSLALPGAPRQASFGSAMVLLGGYLFVGASTGPSGEVFVFERVNGTWVQVHQLAPTQLVPGAGFGESIVGEGSRVIIAASLWPYPGSSATGLLFEYDLSQPGWASQPTTIEKPPGEWDGGFGRSLALAGDRLAIGTDHRAHEYRWHNNGWSRFASVWPPNQGFSSQFARAVALYANGLLVGDPQYDDDPWQYPNNPGGVHAYDLTDYGQPFRGCGRGVALEYGGPLKLEIVWPAGAGSAYQVFGSISGFGPTPVAGINVPLTPDSYTSLLLSYAGSPPFLPGSSGVLDASGRATVTFLVPNGLPLWLDGLQFHHAVVAFTATSLAASNAVTSELVRFW